MDLLEGVDDSWWWDWLMLRVDDFSALAGAERDLGEARYDRLARALAVQWCRSAPGRAAWWVDADSAHAACDVDQQAEGGLCARQPNCHWTEAGAEVFDGGAATEELEAWLASSHYALLPGLLSVTALVAVLGAFYLHVRVKAARGRPWQRFRLPRVKEFTTRESIEFRDRAPLCRVFFRLLWLVFQLAWCFAVFIAVAASLVVILPSQLGGVVAPLDGVLAELEALAGETSARAHTVLDYAPLMAAHVDDFFASSNNTAEMDTLLATGDALLPRAHAALWGLEALAGERVGCAPGSGVCFECLAAPGCLNVTLEAAEMHGPLEGVVSWELGNLTLLYDSITTHIQDEAEAIETATRDIVRRGDAAVLSPWGELRGALGDWRARVEVELRYPQAMAVVALLAAAGTTVWGLLSMALNYQCRWRYALDVNTLPRTASLLALALCFALWATLNMLIVVLSDACLLARAVERDPAGVLLGRETPGTRWALDASLLATDRAFYGNLSDVTRPWAGEHLDWSLNTYMDQLAPAAELAAATTGASAAGLCGAAYANATALRDAALAELNAELAAACERDPDLADVGLAPWEADGAAWPGGDWGNETAGAAYLEAAYGDCAPLAAWHNATVAQALVRRMDAVHARMLGNATEFADVRASLLARLDDGQRLFRRNFFRNNVMRVPRDTARELYAPAGNASGIVAAEAWAETHAACAELVNTAKAAAVLSVFEPLIVLWMMRRMRGIAFRIDRFRLRCDAARAARPTDASQFKYKQKARLKMPGGGGAVSPV